jgi:hypothetical protein
MSNFLNKIPVSPITSLGTPSVPNNSTFGTNFSILQTGGYMEVYTLSGLTYTIPPATTGVIEFSGNSIPIQFTKGSGSVFSPDVLTLNSDNISSGRRKLGMLAYVYETNKIYQFKIDNYDTLWNNATGATGPGGSTVVISDYGTTVKNNSAAGIAFISAWTSSTISGIGGYNDTNASWRVLSTGGGTSFTGGTISGATNFTNGLTANTFSAGTYQNLPVSGVTGGTGISANTTNGLVTIVNTLPDQTVTITGGTNIGINGTYPNFGINFTGSTGASGDYLPLSGGTVTGGTIFTSGLTANTISATTYQNLPVTSFSGLSGINLSATTNGEVLTYSSIDNTWKNEKVYNDLQIRRNGITIFDDMIGTTASDNFQKLTFNNGAWSVSTISNENNPGVITITSSSGSSSSGGNIVPSSTVSPRNYAVGVGMQYDLIMRTGSLSANVIMRFGIVAGTVNATQPSDGVYLRLNNNDLVGQTATGNTRSQTAAYTGITTPTWYHFRVKMASANLSVYELYDMDGALLWTDSLTTNLPTIGTGVQPTFIAYNQIAEARQICQVDYVSFTYPPMNRGALI